MSGSFVSIATSSLDNEVNGTSILTQKGFYDFNFKESCRIATDTGDDLSVGYSYSTDDKTITKSSVGAVTIDGFALVVEDRILVKNQTSASENGIYKVTIVGTADASLVLTRADDFNEDSEVRSGIFVNIEEGTVNANKNFVLTTDNTITLDSTNIAFADILSNTQTKGDILDDLNTLGAPGADGQFIVATGAGAFAYESGPTARTSLGVGTGDSPQFTGIELGHASDTTLTRAAGVSGGDVTIEGNIIYRAGGTDVPIVDGGTGASTASAARTNLGAQSNFKIQQTNEFLGIVDAAGTSTQQTGSSGAGVGLAYLITDQSTNALAGVPGNGPPKSYEITLTSDMTLPLVEYSFAFGDVRSASTQVETSYVRVGVNLHIDDAGSYVLKQAIGNVNLNGGLDGTVSSSGWGSGAGRGTSYYPVFMRYLHTAGLSTGDKIKLTISAPDVVQARIRDIILTVREAV